MRVATLVQCPLTLQFPTPSTKFSNTTIPEFVAYCVASVIFVSIFIVVSVVAAGIVAAFVVAIIAAFLLAVAVLVVISPIVAVKRPSFGSDLFSDTIR